MHGAVPGASLPGALYLSQPRTFTQETTFGNLAQQAARSARGAVGEDRRGSRCLARLRLSPTRHVVPFLGARASCPLEHRGPAARCGRDARAPRSASRKTWLNRPRALRVAPFGVPSMTDSLEVQVLYPARWRRRISEAQGRRREAGSEGSVEQSRDPMDKNRIRGLPGRTSEPMIAKSTAIKGRGGKFGGCAVKAVSLTSGGLRRVRNSRTERARKGRHRGAEVSRGHSSRLADEGPNDGQGQ